MTTPPPLQTSLIAPTAEDLRRQHQATEPPPPRLERITYDVHPYADIWPRLEGKAFRALVESIEENSLQEPIVLYRDPELGGEARILDGRNRYLACHATNHPDKLLRFVFFSDVAEEDIGPLDYVKVKNHDRRQLTRPQITQAAARFTIASKERQRKLQQASARRTNLLRWGDKDTDTDGDGEGITLRTPDTAGEGTDCDDTAPVPVGRSRDLAAKMYDVKPGTIQTAVRMLQKGEPGLAELHEQEWVSNHAAGEIARLPAELQRDIIRQLQACDDALSARKLCRKLLADIARAKAPTTTATTATTASALTPTPTATESAPDPTDADTDADPDTDGDGDDDCDDKAPDAPGRAAQASRRARTVDAQNRRSPAPTPASFGPVPAFAALPDRGPVSVSRNALEVLLAIARGQVDHPHRAAAIAEAAQVLQFTPWHGDGRAASAKEIA